MNAYNEEKPEIYIYIYMSRFKLRLFPNSALSKYKLKPHVLKDRTDHPPPSPSIPHLKYRGFLVLGWNRGRSFL